MHKRNLKERVIKMKNSLITKCLFFVLVSLSAMTLMSAAPKKALAQCNGWGRPCCVACCSSCASEAVRISDAERNITKQYITDQFIYQRQWLVTQVFNNHLLPALMLFTEQMTAMAMNQVTDIGMLLDAKHQLETQRLFQTMSAEAHKSYQPSEGMCTFGTVSRSLAASDRNNDLSAAVFSARMIQRELLSGDNLAGGGRSSDILSRAKQFQELYCNPKDNGNGLSKFCPNPSADKTRYNKDINYTSLIDSPLTLSLDFTAQGNAAHQSNKHPPKNASSDEEDVIALASNLYAHTLPPGVAPSFLTDDQGLFKVSGLTQYMNIRALTAKRSVARNSFAAITAMKSEGETQVQPYLYAIMKEFGLSNQEITDYLGTRPSYNAQMEILTKKLYQNPTFYTELYDKPTNVARKTVSMQAIELMQRRDIYRSTLRSEAILSTMLETALSDPQEAVSNEILRLDDTEAPITLP